MSRVCPSSSSVTFHDLNKRPPSPPDAAVFIGTSSILPLFFFFPEPPCSFKLVSLPHFLSFSSRLPLPLPVLPNPPISFIVFSSCISLTSLISITEIISSFLPFTHNSRISQLLPSSLKYLLPSILRSWADITQSSLLPHTTLITSSHPSFPLSLSSRHCPCFLPLSSFHTFLSLYLTSHPPLSS